MFQDWEVEELIRELWSAGLEPCAYSGRGVYGKPCVAIHTNGHPDSVIWDLSRAIAHIGDPGPPTVDNLGKGYVIYWPEFPWPTDDADEEDGS